MSQENNIKTGDYLDGLLKQSLLEMDLENPANEELLEKLAGEVYRNEWPIPTAQVKVETGTGKNFPWKWVWYLSAITAILLGTGWWITTAKDDNQHNKKSIQQKENKPLSAALEKELKPLPVLPAAGATLIKTKADKKQQQLVPIPKEPESVTVAQSNTNKDTSKIKVIDNNPYTSLIDSVKEFSTEDINAILTPSFALSKEEEEKHLKKKAELRKNWSSLKTRDYSLIQVSGAEGFNKKAYSFYMKRGEVSNGEYRLFLTDLKYTRQKEKYDKACPQYEQWLKRLLNPDYISFMEEYFTSGKYDAYPVVCISTEAMAMYCAWLKEEILSASQNKSLMVEVRLPLEEEWKTAAAAGKKHKYATDNGKLKNLLHGYKAQFRIPDSKPYLSFMQSDSKEQGGNKSETTDSLLLEKHRNQDPDKYTTTATAYMMNSFGMYNMSGNVSEAVWTKAVNGTKKLRTIGGNWNSDKKYLLIEAEDEFNGNTDPSPYLGFRPVVHITIKSNAAREGSE